jgi:hypothetical protein
MAVFWVVAQCSVVEVYKCLILVDDYKVEKLEVLGRSYDTYSFANVIPYEIKKSKLYKILPKRHFQFHFKEILNDVEMLACI